MKCPFCKNRINRYDGRHIYRCDKNKIVGNKEDIKFNYLSYNFPIISKKNILFDEYVVKIKSLPDIKKDYNISYKNILFLLDYYNIKKRTMKISSKKISSKKYKETCLKKYGVDNVSKIKLNKVNKKFNINIEDFNLLQELILTKNFDIKNLNVKKDFKILYNKCYNYWLKLNDEQKNFLINNNNLIETKITNCLDKLNISYTTRFMIGRKFFDIKIKNILIDVNDDLWHANPVFYKENDIMNFPFKKVKAKVIWQRDLNKRNLAESKGYVIHYIWGDDIRNSNFKDITNIISDIMNV